MSETTIYGKYYTAEITLDEDPQDPLDTDDTLVTLLCWHPRYNLGHHKENKYRDLWDALYRMSSDAQLIPLDDRGFEVHDDACDFEEAMDYEVSEAIAKLQEAGYTIQKLYIFDHSGITMSTGSFNCTWDSGMCGIAVITPEERSKGGLDEYTTKQLTEIVNGAVTTYDNYLRGEVYMITTYNRYNEVIESVGGYYSASHVESEAKAALDCLDSKGPTPFSSPAFDDLRKAEREILKAWYIARRVESVWRTSSALAAIKSAFDFVHKQRMAIRTASLQSWGKE